MRSAAGSSALGYTELSIALDSPIIPIQAESQITHNVEFRSVEDELAKEYTDICVSRIYKVEILIGY